MNVMKKKMKKLQDYSLPSSKMSSCGVDGYCSPVCVRCNIKRVSTFHNNIKRECFT
jgi:hypothetical protein